MASSKLDKAVIYLASASVILPAIILTVSGVTTFMDGFMEGVNMLNSLNPA